MDDQVNFTCQMVSDPQFSPGSPATKRTQKVTLPRPPPGADNRPFLDYHPNIPHLLLKLKPCLIPLGAL